jgi:threonine aldolase
MPDHFLTLVKQQGALIAKGRLLGVQFDTLFTDELYMKISRHAIDMAQKLKDILRERGYEFFIDSHTNQQFIVIENGKLEKLREHIAVGFWEKYDDSHTVIRLATSWATTEDDLEELKRYI